MRIPERGRALRASGADRDLGILSSSVRLERRWTDSVTGPPGGRFRGMDPQQLAVRTGAAVRHRPVGARAGVIGATVLRAGVPPQWLRCLGRGDEVVFAWLGTGAASALPAIMEW